MRRVERHVLQRADRRFPALDRAALASKHRYNQALYAPRQACFQDGAFPSSPTLDPQLTGAPA